MTISQFIIEDLTTKQMTDVRESIVSLDTSWTMDAVTQLTVKLYDKDIKMFLNNYFMVRRAVRYQNVGFEIAAVEVDGGTASGGDITLECRRREIQAMKRDKTPEAYGGVTATDYARIVAQKFGLKFVGEGTSTKRSITKQSGPDNDESVWDVLRRLASEAQFSVFESDGTLYFASQEWLLNKWGNFQFRYPVDLASPFQVIGIPNCRRSDDDPLEAEVRFLLRRSSTTMGLRPGMTVILSGMGEFNRAYLVTEVAYGVSQPEPIGVAARTPVKKKPKSGSTETTE